MGDMQISKTLTSKITHDVHLDHSLFGLPVVSDLQMALGTGKCSDQIGQMQSDQSVCSSHMPYELCGLANAILIRLDEKIF